MKQPDSLDEFNDQIEQRRYGYQQGYKAGLADAEKLKKENEALKKVYEAADKVDMELGHICHDSNWQMDTYKKELREALKEYEGRK